MEKFTLKVQSNPPGYKRYTVSLSQRGKGVVFETHNNSIKSAMKETSDWVVYKMEGN
jgi:hypothetical protein